MFKQKLPPAETRIEKYYTKVKGQSPRIYLHPYSVIKFSYFLELQYKVFYSDGSARSDWSIVHLNGEFSDAHSPQFFSFSMEYSPTDDQGEYYIMETSCPEYSCDSETTILGRIFFNTEDPPVQSVTVRLGQNLQFKGLPPKRLYRIELVYTDSAGNKSNVIHTAFHACTTEEIQDEICY